MPTASTNFALSKPTVGGDADVWGGYLNTNVIDKLDTLLGAPTTGGSGAAYTLTSGATITAYANQRLAFKASFTSNAAATLNVDGLGAKNITKNGTTATVSGDIVSGGVYVVGYDGTQFQILSGPVGAGFQPLDADLTAIAALGYTSGAYVIKKTAADTWALVDEASYAHLAGTETFTGAKTFSAQPTISMASARQDWYQTGGGSNAKRWSFIAESDTFYFQTRTDADVFGASVLTVARSGTTVGAVALTGTSFTHNGSTVYTAANLPGTAITWTAIENFQGTVAIKNNSGTIKGYIGADNQVDGAASDGITIRGESIINFSLNGSRVGYIDGTLTSLTKPIQARAASSTETTGTLTSASANKSIIATGGITLPNAVFTAGDTILIDGGGTARTITRGSGVTMYKAGSDSATATLAANGLMTVFWRTASVCVLGGDIS